MKRLHADLTKSSNTVLCDVSGTEANATEPSLIHSCPIMFFRLQKHFSLAIVLNKEQERAWV